MRIEAGEKDAIASAKAIVEATSGRQGQLAAFAEYWEKFHRNKGASDDDYHRFPLKVIRKTAELLLPLRSMGLGEKETHGPPNQTTHDYLPAMKEMEITVKK